MIRMVGRSFEINSTSYRGIPRLWSSFLSTLFKFEYAFTLNKQKVNCEYKCFFCYNPNKKRKEVIHKNWSKWLERIHSLLRAEFKIFNQLNNNIIPSHQLLFWSFFEFSEYFLIKLIFDRNLHYQNAYFLTGEVRYDDL